MYHNWSNGLIQDVFPSPFHDRRFVPMIASAITITIYCSPNSPFSNLVLKFSTTLKGMTYTGWTNPTRSLSYTPSACIFSALGPSPVQLKPLVSLPLSDLTGASVS